MRRSSSARPGLWRAQPHTGPLPAVEVWLRTIALQYHLYVCCMGWMRCLEESPS